MADQSCPRGAGLGVSPGRSIRLLVLSFAVLAMLPYLVAFFLFAWREFDDVLDGIVYGAMVGLGFACPDFFNDQTQNGLGREHSPFVRGRLRTKP